MKKQELRYIANKVCLFVSIFLTCLFFLYDYKVLVIIGLVAICFIIKKGVKLGKQRFN